MGVHRAPMGPHGPPRALWVSLEMRIGILGHFGLSWGSCSLRGMPALPVVANTLEMKLIWAFSSDTDILCRSFWLYSGSAPSNTGLNTMATSVSTAYSSDLKPLVVGNISLKQIEIIDLSSPTAGIGFWSGSIAGTRTGSLLPAGVSCLINYDIGRRYRGGKPRNYFPFGVQADLNTGQTWTSAFTSAVATGYTSFQTAVLAAGPSGTTVTNQVNVSYYSGFTAVKNPVTGRYRNVPTVRTSVTPDTITAFTVNGSYASQRRRNRPG